MELTTFGALLRFALELEGKVTAFYREAARAARAERLKSALEELARECERHRQRLERERRENINEMLLESILGLKAEDYQVALDASAQGQHDKLLDQALELETTLEKFYREAVSRLSVPEVARGLTRLAEAHGRHRLKLSEVQTMS